MRRKVYVLIDESCCKYSLGKEWILSWFQRSKIHTFVKKLRVKFNSLVAKDAVLLKRGISLIVNKKATMAAPMSHHRVTQFSVFLALYLFALAIIYKSTKGSDLKGALQIFHVSSTFLLCYCKPVTCTCVSLWFYQTEHYIDIVSWTWMCQWL